MKNLETNCFVNKTTLYGQQMIDPMRTVFNEGLRAVWLHIQTMMKMNIARMRDVNKMNPAGDNSGGDV